MADREPHGPPAAMPARPRRTPKRAARYAHLAIPLVLVSCTTAWQTTGLGRYTEYQPWGRVVSGTYEIELERAGHVSIIGVVVPLRSQDNSRHFTFRPLFPRTEADSTFYPPGRHAARHTRVIENMRRLCDVTETPTVGGCRRGRPGGIDYGDAGRVPQHFLMVVSSRLVDPYTLADVLEFTHKTEPEFALALQQRDIEAAAGFITNAIVDLPGSPDWAAFYVMEK